MKNLFTALLLSLPLPSFANIITCEDFYAREFKGVIKIEIPNQIATNITYNDSINIPFSRVNPNHQTRGNSEYFISIPEVFEGKLKLRIDGDVLLYNEIESYFLSCETND